MGDFLAGLREGIKGGQRAFGSTSAASGLSFFGSSSAVSAASTFNLLEAYNTSPIFRRVVGLIADSLASTRWYLVRAKNTNRRSKVLSLWARNATKRSTRTKGLAESEPITEHPFLTFLSLGSPLLSGPAGLKLSYAYYDTKGEFAWLLVPDGTEKATPIAWLPIPPHWLQGYPTTPQSVVKVNFRGSKVDVPGSSLFWRTDPRLIDPFGRGSGMGETLSDELDTDEYAADLMRTVFANKGFVDMLISVNTSDNKSLLDAEARYNANHRGVSQAGRALFIGGDKVSAVPVTQPLSELRLLELREYQRKLIGQVYGVPPELLGEVGDRSRASAVQAEITFAKHVLVPRLEAMRLDMQTRLLPYFDERGEYLLEYEDPTPDDIDARAALMVLAPHAYTLNEWRAVAGHSKEDWGSVRTVPFGTVEANGAAPVYTPLPQQPETKAFASTDPLRLLLGAPAVLRKAFPPGGIKSLLQHVSAQALAAKLVPEWTTRMQAVARGELKGLGVSGQFDLVNPRILDDMEAFAGDRCKYVTDTTQDALKTQLQAGIAEGEGVDAIRKRVETVFGDLESWRAEAIARTEVMRSANRSNLFAWEESGLTLMKQWVATRDPPRVRESHLALDRITVTLSGKWVFDARLEPFVSGTATAPGDASAAAHSINCRCTHVAFDPEHGKMLSYDDASVLYKGWKNSIEPWQSRGANLIGEFARETQALLVDALGEFA